MENEFWKQKLFNVHKEPEHQCLLIFYNLSKIYEDWDHFNSHVDVKDEDIDILTKKNCVELLKKSIDYIQFFAQNKNVDLSSYVPQIKDEERNLLRDIYKVITLLVECVEYGYCGTFGDIENEEIRTLGYSLEILNYHLNKLNEKESSTRGNEQNS